MSAALLVAGAWVAADIRRDRGPGETSVTGPMRHLLAASVDLGPSRADDAQLTAELVGPARPDDLMGWAGARGLSVRWRPGETWAIVEGNARNVASAFGVDVHDFRGRRGQVFYAALQQAAVPESLRATVTAVGRILGFTPYHESRPWYLPRDVPDRGLTPAALVTAYNATPLTEQGYTGKGQTIVVFAFDGFDQADLDLFATTFDLPKFTPTVVGDMPSERTGEATMDLEMAHALAPDARKVFVNARPTVTGDGAYEKIAQMMESADRQFPGAVWSFSIGWGCDKLFTAADLAPVRSALVAAHKHGTTAFNASGDLAGLECKGRQDWSAPPGPDDIGLDVVASLPEMTSVGGTTLSTSGRGEWIGEQSWFDVPLSHGTGGGVSALFDRPAWQRGVLPDRDSGHRLTPDVAAVADQFTGAQIVFGQQILVGGGTSMSAPIWAGIAAVISQYLSDHGGRPLGDINPLLYRIAAVAELPAFRDVSLGGNAVQNAGPGYDMTTGLGTPNVDNLARDLLIAQAASP